MILCKWLILYILNHLFIFANIRLQRHNLLISLLKFNNYRQRVGILKKYIHKKRKALGCSAESFVIGIKYNINIYLTTVIIVLTAEPFPFCILIKYNPLGSAFVSNCTEFAPLTV